MNSIKVGCLFLMIGLLAGCAGGKHVYTPNGSCLTCINNPITGKPVNHDGSAPGSTMESRRSTTAGNQSSSDEIDTSKRSFNEQKTTFSVPMDVDVAFIKVKREYGYLTEQEIRQEWGELTSMKTGTFAYAFDATPSVYYRMRGAKNHKSAMYVIEHQIEKQSANQSQIIITVWVDTRSTMNPADVAKSLAIRTRRSLNQ